MGTSRKRKLSSVGIKKLMGEPVSRILSPVQGTGAVIIPLSDLPGSHLLAPKNEARAGPALLPYLVLLRAGFAVPQASQPARWALTPPFHPHLRRHPGG